MPLLVHRLACASSLFLALSAMRLALICNAIHERSANALRDQWLDDQMSTATDTQSAGEPTCFEPDSPVWDCFDDPYVRAQAAEHLNRCFSNVTQNTRHRTERPSSDH